VNGYYCRALWPGYPFKFKAKCAFEGEFGLFQNTKYRRRAPAIERGGKPTRDRFFASLPDLEFALPEPFKREVQHATPQEDFKGPVACGSEPRPGREMKPELQSVVAASIKAIANAERIG